jgi:hypothetical protein
MMVARHFRRRLLILSVSTLGFFISSVSVVLASDFSGPVGSVLDGDTIEILHNDRIACPKKGQARQAGRVSMRNKKGPTRPGRPFLFTYRLRLAFPAEAHEPEADQP